jgi:hypothetical protein
MPRKDSMPPARSSRRHIPHLQSRLLEYTCIDQQVGGEAMDTHHCQHRHGTRSYLVKEC